MDWIQRPRFLQEVRPGVAHQEVVRGGVGCWELAQRQEGHREVAKTLFVP